MPDMCIHLIGRTEAVMRHKLLGIFDGFDGKAEFHIGDRIIRKNKRSGEVIGFAIGKNGEPCLVLSMHDGHWKTYLCPLSEAKHLRVPTLQEVKAAIAEAIQDAADGSAYTQAMAEDKAERILELAHACFTNAEYPVGGSK